MPDDRAIRQAIFDLKVSKYRREVRDADRWYGRLEVNVWRRLADRRIDQSDRDVLSRLLLDRRA